MTQMLMEPDSTDFHADIDRKACGGNDGNDGVVVVTTFLDSGAIPDSSIFLSVGVDWAEFTADQARALAAELVKAADRLAFHALIHGGNR